MKKVFENIAKLVIDGRENYSDDDMCKFLTFKLWKKGDLKRVYINDYKRRTVGFLENGEFVLKDNCGLNKNEISKTIERFTKEYEVM